MDELDIKYTCYELKKFKNLPLLVFIDVVLLALIVASIFSFNYLYNTIFFFYIPLILVLSVGFISILYYIFTNYNKYDKVFVSEESKMVLFVVGGVNTKVVPFGLIKNVRYYGNKVSFKTNNSTENLVFKDIESATNFDSQIRPLEEILAKYSPEFNMRIIPIIIGLIFLPLLPFSYLNCNCDRESGRCVLKTYNFLSKPEVNVFEIKELSNIELDVYHGSKGSRFYSLLINLETNGAKSQIRPVFSFSWKIQADTFVKQLMKYKNSNEKEFNYKYVSPVILLSIFVLTFSILALLMRIKYLEWKFLAITIAIASIISYIFISNFEIDISPNETKESEVVGYYYRARELVVNKKYDEALLIYDKAEKIYPEDYYIKLEISDIYRNKKEYKNSIYYAQQAINLIKKNKSSAITKSEFYVEDMQSSYLSSLYNIAYSYYKLEDYNNAVIYYTKLLEDKSNTPKDYLASRLNRGKCYLKLGEEEKALKDFVTYKKVVLEFIKNNSTRYNAKHLAEVNKLIKSVENGNNVIEEASESSEELYSKYKKIVVNEPSEYDNLTKQEILDLRKKYVAQSMFNSRYYKPSEKVFGGIVDKKPWYGLDNVACPFVPEVASGKSARSIYINNPTLLLGVIKHLGHNYPADTPFCRNKIMQFIPSSMYYDDSKNMIIVVYKVDDSVVRDIQQPKYGIPLAFVGLNARDFGYNYVYAYDYYNLYFTKENNVSNEVYTPLDYLHVGSSCRLPGGCNNTSPLQPKFEFMIRELPAGVMFKLWKHSPFHLSQKGDIYLKIVFEK